MNAKAITAKLRSLASTAYAERAASFFKTGPGEYGEGDQFLGVRNPQLHQLVRECRGTPLAECLKVLPSQYNEERLLALLLMVDLFERGDAVTQEAVYKAYLANTARVNNWNLIDLSAHKIVGAWLIDKDRKPLYALAASDDLWEQRIAIVACYWFIKHDDFEDILAISERLLNHPHDLIHKAIGWMLREVGKRDQAAEERFLKQHYKLMPRTMLRYAIERFPKPLYRAYLEGRV